MGRLIDPGIGELVDRLTILRLKLLHAPQDVATSHFQSEEAQIQMRLDALGHPASDDVLVAQVQLLQQNAQLWRLEDRMAEYVAHPDNDDRAVAMTAIAIWRANRRRNALIQQINTLAGTVRGPEKL